MGEVSRGVVCLESRAVKLELAVMSLVTWYQPTSTVQVCLLLFSSHYCTVQVKILIRRFLVDGIEIIEQIPVT